MNIKQQSKVVGTNKVIVLKCSLCAFRDIDDNIRDFVIHSNNSNFLHFYNFFAANS